MVIFYALITQLITQIARYLHEMENLKFCVCLVTKYGCKIFMIMKANLLGINKLGHVIDLLKNVAEQIIKERRKIRIIMEFKN